MPRTSVKAKEDVSTPENVVVEENTVSEPVEPEVDDGFTREQILDFLKKKAPFEEPDSVFEAFNLIGNVWVNTYISDVSATTIAATADLRFGDYSAKFKRPIELSGSGIAALLPPYQESLNRAIGNAVRNAISHLGIPVKYLIDPDQKINANPVTPPARTGGYTRSAPTPKTDDIPTESDVQTCTDCDGDIVEATDSNGNVWTAESIIKNSMKDYGVALCWQCKNKRWRQAQKGKSGGGGYGRGGGGYRR